MSSLWQIIPTNPSNTNEFLTIRQITNIKKRKKKIGYLRFHFVLYSVKNI